MLRAPKGDTVIAPSVTEVRGFRRKLALRD
jgi:hypothetical protein